MESQGSLFENLPQQALPNELFDILLQGKAFKLERIVSTGQVTPDDLWMDQVEDEWVLLLQGEAVLLFDDEEELNLAPGDYCLISAHRRHRVSWTDPKRICIWLTLSFIE